MNDFDKLFNKGYSIKQINEILKTSGDERTTMCLLSPHISETLFKKIRKSNNIDFKLILTLNKLSEKELSLIENNENEFNKFIGDYSIKKGCRTFKSTTPLIFDAMEHRNMIILGMQGTGKSFIEKMSMLKIERN